MIIATIRTDPWHESYASDDVPSATALKQWLNRRKRGKRAFTREEELDLAIRVGVALAHKQTVIEYHGECIELLY